MRLRIPPPRIDPESPFDSLFSNREKFGRSLHNLLISSEGGFVAFIDGNWGIGKSTFIEAFRAFVRISPAGDPSHDGTPKQSPDTILFDAFAHDSQKDPFESFVGEISSFSRGLLTKKERSKFIDKSLKVIANISTTFISGGIGFATSALAHSQGLDPNLSQLLATGTAKGVSGFSQEAKDALFEKIEQSSGLEENSESFSEALSSLAREYRKATGFPLTIVIDELDRCSPPYALRLIERIKHFFHVEGVCFLIFANVSQIESHVEAVYGSIDASNYLKKFADFTIKFPIDHSQDKRWAQGNAVEYSKYLRNEHGCGQEYHAIWDAFASVINHLELSLREIESTARALLLMEATKTRPHEFTGILAAIAVKSRSDYNLIKKGNLKLSEFLSFFGLNPSNIPSGLSLILPELAAGCLAESELISFYDILKTEKTWRRSSAEARGYLDYAIERLEIFNI